MAPRKHIGVPFWSYSILFPHVMSYFIFGTLKYNFISLDYEFQGMVLTPSCKGLGVDLGPLHTMVVEVQKLWD